MLHSTQGIVFHSVKYSDTSLIVKIYTGLFGIRSYIFRGVRNPKSRIKAGFFQPLTLLDMVVYHREKQTLQSVKEIRLSHPYHSIPFDIQKSSLVLFMNEVLYHSIREEEANPELFSFIYNTCVILDETAVPVASFHLLFMLQLCHHLGIFPQVNFSVDHPVFNMAEGQFQSTIPDHPHYFDPATSQLLYQMLRVSATDLRILYPPAADSASFAPIPAVAPEREAAVGGITLPAMNATLRNQMVERLLQYYELHLPGFRKVMSHRILHGIFI